MGERQIGFGFALDVFPFEALEGVAQLKSKLAYGKAEPCLTTTGKARSNETGLLRQSNSNLCDQRWVAGFAQKRKSPKRQFGDRSSAFYTIKRPSGAKRRIPYTVV